MKKKQKRNWPVVYDRGDDEHFSLTFLNFMYQTDTANKLWFTKAGLEDFLECYLNNCKNDKRESKVIAKEYVEKLENLAEAYNEHADKKPSDLN
jgi:uncharacterized protein YsxB (DUF464 family)